MVGGAGVQLRLNQPTWLLSGPHDNPLRGPGAVDAVALPLGHPLCPAPQALGEMVTCLECRLRDSPGMVCAQDGVAGRAWGLKGSVGYILGALREGTTLRQR